MKMELHLYSVFSCLGVTVLTVGGCFIAFYGKSCFIPRCLGQKKSAQYQYLALTEHPNQKHNIPMSELYPPLINGLLGEKESSKPTDCLIDTQSSVVYT